MLTQSENHDLNNSTIRYIQNTFPVHQGIMFVIETNKLLRIELKEHEEAIRKLQGQLNFWKKQATDVLDAYNKMTFEAEAKDEMIQALNVGKECRNFVVTMQTYQAKFKVVQEKNEKHRKHIENLQTKNEKLQRNLDYYIARSAQNELRVKQLCEQYSVTDKK